MAPSGAICPAARAPASLRPVRPRMMSHCMAGHLAQLSAWILLSLDSAEAMPAMVMAGSHVSHAARGTAARRIARIGCWLVPLVFPLFIRFWFLRLIGLRLVV